MIYLICILIFIFYFYILYKNPGEKSTLIHGKTTTIIIISLSFILISFIFLSLSNVDNMTEYENISKRNKDIRNNIVTIKNNIPLLREKLSLEPNYYQGWVILAKSYLIIDDISASVAAYENALQIDSTDKIILQEYIVSLRKESEKVNKVKILKAYDRLLKIDNLDINILNDKLNYSIDINDSNLTIKILRNIIKNPKIKNKTQYKEFLAKLINHGASSFEFNIIISNKLREKISNNKYIFFIIKDEKKLNIPFAVKRVQKNDVNNKITINNSNIMMGSNNTPMPDNIILSIKVSDEKTISKDNSNSMLYVSKLINITNFNNYTIDDKLILP
tara:strand:+ start:4053 stop:5051 length:999 start_codon:yes stop_codon:yes gene_type:complete